MVSGEREALRLYKSNKCIDNETLKEYSKIYTSTIFYNGKGYFIAQNDYYCYV